MLVVSMQRNVCVHRNLPLVTPVHRKPGRLSSCAEPRITLTGWFERMPFPRQQQIYAKCAAVQPQLSEGNEALNLAKGGTRLASKTDCTRKEKERNAVDRGIYLKTLVVTVVVVVAIAACFHVA